MKKSHIVFSYSLHQKTTGFFQSFNFVFPSSQIVILNIKFHFLMSQMFSDQLTILIFCLFLYLHSFLWLDIPYSIHLEVLLHLVNTVYILMQISVFHLPEEYI